MAGRKWKYRNLIETLEDNELYHVSKIIRDAEDRGFFDHHIDTGRPLEGKDQLRAIRNARAALGNMAASKMPEADGEVEVTEPYKAFYRAWYGRTWKQVLL